MRPFGISVFLCGFDEGKPHFYKTEPSGAYAEWKANAIGKKSKELTEFLEKKYEEGMNQDAAIRLAIATLSEVVEGA
jgi:20S proteasome subunit alpha 4